MAIAAGVVLIAASDCRLIIESGVCIGTGVVIQAYGGDLTLAAGASLGRDALLIGTGTIGAGACIGAESTLINPQVAATAVVAARSLIGASLPAVDTASTNGNGNGFTPAGPAAGDLPPDAAIAEPDAVNGDGALTTGQPVYGQAQVMQLIKTLFPHRDSLNGNGQAP
ncbi:MAG TPA: hypothetical protein V6D02_14235 [Candidatus Obscuribacterales bacterium]